MLPYQTASKRDQPEYRGLNSGMNMSGQCVTNLPLTFYLFPTLETAQSLPPETSYNDCPARSMIMTLYSMFILKIAH
jgi:hypothetical protein